LKRLALVLPVLAAGCANDSRAKTGDPLTGGGPEIPARSQTASAPAPQSRVPPIPVPSSATSAAALAGGAYQPLDPTRELSIGNGNPKPAAGTWRDPNAPVQASLTSPQPGATGTAPGQLTSLPTAPNRPTAQPAPIRPVTTSPGASADALLALLKARGVTWYRLENLADSGECKFSCSIPNPTNPNIRRTYEARGQDPRAAMIAILQQIDKEGR
jgi:hypothetical protein